MTPSNRKQMFRTSSPVAEFAAFAEFYDTLTAPDVRIPFNVVHLGGLKAVTDISPHAVSLAAEQVKVLGSFLRNKLLSGMTLAWLVCGLQPMTAEDKAAHRMRTLLGEEVRISARPVRDAAWILRKWSFAEENVGFVDYVDFFAWCDEIEIDTNYLRLMRELTGCGATLEIGSLPLTTVVKFGRSF